VITNFIDNSEFDDCSECQRTQFANPDEKILIHVSNLRPVKRVDEVLQIFKNVEKKVKSKLIIIGEGPDMEKVNQFLEENPDLISKSVFWGKSMIFIKFCNFRMYFFFRRNRKVLVWQH
jgi:glycosyltransferase involved in cell wall biosynthesis